MGRNLSPIVRRQLENLDKDPDSRRSAMKALKTYVKDLDTKAIPLFLAQVSETKEACSSTGEYTISLYEVLARVHGCNIVPQIENIMSTIVQTLSSSAGSFPIHQACAKVVPAIARYGINPTTPEREKTRIICSLCKPLSDVLMCPRENAASGAALCLKALVDCDNWRFASDDVVNEVCLKLAGALEEKLTQTNAHMGLVMALSKQNALIIEAYARSLIRSGLQILATGSKESNSQKRLSAVQMINFLMKCVDSRSISSDLAKVIDGMEKCQSDLMPFVGGAAFEALQTAKMISGQKGSRHERSPSPVIGSNFDRKNGRIRSWASTNMVNTNDGGSSMGCPSPELRTIESFVDYESFVHSPMSVGQASSNFDYARHANRRLWDNDARHVDISLKDGLFYKVKSEGNSSEVEAEQLSNAKPNEIHNEQSRTFSGLVQSSATNAMKRDITPSPQRSRPQLTVDDVKIYSTPRKLIRSLQSSSTSNSGDHQKQHIEAFPNFASDEVDCNPAIVLNRCGHSHKLNCDIRRRNMETMETLQDTIHDSGAASDSTESILSTCVAPAGCSCKTLCQEGCEDKDSVQIASTKRRYSISATSIICCFMLIVLVVFFSAIWADNDEVFYVVPT